MTQFAQLVVEEEAAPQLPIFQEEAAPQLPIFQSLPDDADEKDSNGDVLPPQESDSRRQNSASTTLVIEGSQRAWFPAGNDALVSMHAVDVVDTDVFEGSSSPYRAKRRPIRPWVETPRGCGSASFSNHCDRWREALTLLPALRRVPEFKIFRDRPWAQNRESYH